MATYLELSNLATDGSFQARIGYAIGKYASYIFNEASDAANHGPRLNWALKAMAQLPAMSQSLAPAVCRDDAVVEGLAAVTDADLQIAFENAANVAILTPISYADLMALATDQAFLRRVQIAIAKFAAYVLNEAPNTPNHGPRYQWAKGTMLNTMGIASALASAIVVDETVAANLAATTDAQLQTAVETKAALLLL